MSKMENPFLAHAVLRAPTTFSGNEQLALIIVQVFVGKLSELIHSVSG